MKKYIHITKEDREFLMRAFGVTRQTVQNALRFDSERGDTELARKIRKVAQERGGIVMAVAPEVETLHDHDGYMRQYMPNGALIELSKKDASGDVFFKGDKVKHYDYVAISEIEGIQNWAAALK